MPEPVTISAGMDPTITFNWSLGQHVFLRLEPSNKGTLIQVAADLGGGKMYQVRFQHDNSFTARWYYGPELDSDIT